MGPLSCLEDMLSEYRPLFKHNNFNPFETFVKGLINTPHRGTLTRIYLSTEQSQTYWCLAKFLSRGVWCVDEVTAFLMRQMQTVYGTGVYVYLETVLLTLNRHGYKPKYLTRGLRVAYLQRCLQQNYFLASYAPGENSQKKLKNVEDST